MERFEFSGLRSRAMMLAQALPIANALLSGRDFEICTILPSSYGIVPETAAKVFHPAFTEKIKCFQLASAVDFQEVDRKWLSGLDSATLLVFQPAVDCLSYLHRRPI